MPWGDVCIVKEYYVYDRGIKQNAKGIVEDLCGNSRRLLTEYGEPGDDPVFEEIQDNMEFYSSELDIRSFGKKTDESGLSIGTVYNMNGCECQPASGEHDNILLPFAVDAFLVDRNRKHINQTLYEKGERPQPWTGDVADLGGSMMYVFALCVNVKSEIESHGMNPKTNKPIAGQDNHCVSCVKYFTAKDRPYMGDGDSGNVTTANVPRCSETGY